MDESQVISLAADGYAVAAFIGYLLLLAGIGVYSSRFSSEGISEFFIGWVLPAWPMPGVPPRYGR